MAIMDYGALTWKDGVLLSETEFFDDMQEMVGWNDEGQENQLAHNWFTYIGDEELTIMFYKYCMKIYSKGRDYYNDVIYFGSENFEGWRKWEQLFIINAPNAQDDHLAKLTVRKAKFGTYYIAILRYKGHKWKVTFGSGVCYDTYTKYHIMSAWNMPSHKWYRFKMDAKQLFCYDLKRLSMWEITYWFKKISWKLRRNKYD